jgi:hypothetical protein
LIWGVKMGKTRTELINEGRVFISDNEVYNLKTDIQVLRVPGQVVCETPAGYNSLLSKLQACNIGTSSTFENLTITS